MTRKNIKYIINILLNLITAEKTLITKNNGFMLNIVMKLPTWLSSLSCVFYFVFQRAIEYYQIK